MPRFGLTVACLSWGGGEVGEGESMRDLGKGIIY